MQNRKYVWLAMSIALMLFLPTLHARETQPQVVVWPETGPPVLQFTFPKFRQMGWNGNQRVYAIDTEVKNLSNRSITQASFNLYLYDKNNIRIGDAWLTVSNAAPGDVIKFETNATVSGQPVSVKLAPRAPKSISMTVNSVPQGAHFTLDGKDEGVTPKEIEVGVGTHLLEFDKEGFNHGKYPLAIGANDVSGGSVSYELGASAHDTIELRDGSVVSGDLLSITATDVTVQVGGIARSFNRNQVKRITLVQREQTGQ
jgi:hypothetical protein